MGVTKAEGGRGTDMMKLLRLNGVTEGELKKKTGFYDRALFAALFKGGKKEQRATFIFVFSRNESE